MRKIFIVLFLVILITGCSKKPLKCSLSINNSTMDLKKVYSIYSDDDVISEVNVSETYLILDDKLKLTFNSMVNFMKSDYDSKNLSYDYSNDGNKYIFNIKYNFSSLNDEVYNQMFGTKSTLEYKEKLITQGFVCK